jgi:hypothetical protein
VLRITPSPHHADADIERLVQALAEIWEEVGLVRAAQSGSGESQRYTRRRSAGLSENRTIHSPLPVLTMSQLVTSVLSAILRNQKAGP